MDVNRYLEHCNEQNRQVNNHERTDPGYSKESDKTNEDLMQGSSFEDRNAILEARVKALKETMSSLKTELMEEKALWRKEMEQLSSLMTVGNDRLTESDPNLLGIGEQDNDYKSVMNIPITGSDPVVPAPLIRDYEEKINRYQGALAQAQAEKRFNIRRQIAANTYRKRLNEVEKLCQEELAKVRETATFLEPLKQIASEWNKPKSHHYDSLKSPVGKSLRRRVSQSVECGGDFLPVRGRETQTSEEEEPFEVPVKQIDASLVMDEDATSEIKGKIVLQIGSLPSEVPTICYSAKFE